MKKRVLISTGLFFALFATMLIHSEKNSSIVFKHVNLIPMDSERVVADQAVIVQDGKITAIGPSGSLKIPDSAIVINGKGKYMMPALADMHVHLEGDAWNLLCPPGSKFSKDDINFADILYLYLANGISMIDVMSALPEHIKLREKIEKKEIQGPRLILSKMIDGPGKAWPPPISTWVKDGKEAEAAVRSFHQQGYGRVKVYSFLSKASYDSIMKTAKELNMPVDGHIPMSTSVEYVLDAGQNMIAHVEEVMKYAKGFSPEEVERLAGVIAKSDTWVTSTLSVSKNLISLFRNHKEEFSKSGAEYLHPMGKAVWAYIYHNLYKPIPENARQHIRKGFRSFQVPFIYEFHKKGGKLLAGTDALVPSTLPGLSLHKELELLVEAGLSAYEALKTSTTNPHEFLGESGISGTIEVGKKANLLLLDKNPLKSISNTKTIAGVLTQGKWMTKKMIDLRMKKITAEFRKLTRTKTDQIENRTQ